MESPGQKKEPDEVSRECEDIDKILTSQIEPGTKSRDEKTGIEAFDAHWHEILEITQRATVKSRERIWNRVLRSLDISSPNSQCLLFSRLLSGEIFPQLTPAQKADFVAKLADFYGKGKESSYYSYNRVGYLIRTEELPKLNQAVFAFFDREQLPSSLDNEFAKATNHQLEDNYEFLVETVYRLKDQRQLPEDFYLRRFSRSASLGQRLNDPELISLVYSPSYAAILWATLWRILLLPLTIGEALIRGFDKYIAMPVQRWSEETGRGQGIAFLLQSIKNLGLLVFAPEKLITQYPRWKWAIRAVNILAWVGLGIACPPLFAKLGLSLPFVALGELGPLSTSQVFWMVACPTASTARQSVEYIGKHCFNWGGEHQLSLPTSAAQLQASSDLVRSLSGSKAGRDRSLSDSTTMKGYLSLNEAADPQDPESDERRHSLSGMGKLAFVNFSAGDSKDSTQPQPQPQTPLSIIPSFKPKYGSLS